MLKSLSPAHFVEEALSDPQFTEDRLALGFAETHATELRYVAAWGKWLVWTGTHWQDENTLAVFDLARKICRAAAARRNKPSTSTVLAKAKTVAAVEMLTRSDRRIAATKDQWDVSASTLNAQGDLANLLNLETRPTRPDDFCTKSTAVKIGDGKPALFLAFLNRIMNGDSDLVAYLQRVLGYCCTGSTAEHAMFFFYGTGANGKSVLLSTVAGILGSYHKTAAIETFTAQPGVNHPTDLAHLMGARLVTAIEVEEGRRWAESKIKALTGGDEISARFMRQDFFTFKPQFKLIVAGNHKPSLRTVDEAMRRRLQIVPFAMTIPEAERDLELTEKLKAEWPQILKWMIEGCLAWQQIGLAPPAAVQDATAAYFEAQDNVQAWIDECCTVAADQWEPSSTLFALWKKWAEAAGVWIGAEKELIDAIKHKLGGYRPIGADGWAP